MSISKKIFPNTMPPGILRLNLNHTKRFHRYALFGEPHSGRKTVSSIIENYFGGSKTQIFEFDKEIHDIMRYVKRKANFYGDNNPSLYHFLKYQWPKEAFGQNWWNQLMINKLLCEPRSPVLIVRDGETIEQRDILKRFNFEILFITRNESHNILAPFSDKIIYNEGSIEELKKNVVEALWKR